MKPISALQYFTWSKFSNPSNNRVAYRAIRKHKFRSIVEVGLGAGVRCERMIRVAQKFSGAATIRYTGIDAFEGRDPEEAPLKLIEMHRQLNGLGAKAQLVPGDFSNAIERIANAHLRTDLIVVQIERTGNVFDDADFAHAWRFLPRMLHASSLVMLLYPKDEYEVFNFLDVEAKERELAAAASQLKRAA